MSPDSGQDRLPPILTPILPFVGRPWPATTPLPNPPTRLIGREREARDVGALLRRDDVRLVTLTGSGGIGKTRLALRVAGEVGADLFDNTVWVPLAAIR